MGNIFNKGDYSFKDGSREEFWCNYPESWKENAIHWFNNELNKIEYTSTRGYIVLPKKYIYGYYYLGIYKMFKQSIYGTNRVRSDCHGDFVEQCINSIKNKINKPFIISIIELEELDNEYEFLGVHYTDKKDMFVLSFNFVL